VYHQHYDIIAGGELAIEKKTRRNEWKTPDFQVVRDDVLKSAKREHVSTTEVQCSESWEKPNCSWRVQSIGRKEAT
jgi:hypothetical protein